jgi:hypothetical protein
MPLTMLERLARRERPCATGIIVGAVLEGISRLTVFGVGRKRSEVRIVTLKWNVEMARRTREF